MKLYKIQGETMSAIGDAIRAKNGENAFYNPADMADAIGQLKTGGGFASLHIAYGSVEPEDTTKLWVKTDAPAVVHMRSNMEGASETLYTDVGQLSGAAHGAAAATVGNKVYLFGGHSGKQYLSSIYVYDTESKTASTLETTMPTPASYMSAVAVGTKVYVFGGNASGTALNKIHVFDTETNGLSTLDITMQYAAYAMAAALVGKKVYLFGGETGSVKTNLIQVFDTETYTINKLSIVLSMGGARYVAAAPIGSKVYLFGGDSGIFINTIAVFDADTDTMSNLSVTLPSVTRGIATAAIGTKIYLFGGAVTTSSYLTTIRVFDTETNTLTTLDATLPVPCCFVSIGVVGGRIYLLGGHTRTVGILSSIHEFAAALTLEQDHLLIEVSLTDNLVNLLVSDVITAQMGVANVYWGNSNGCAEKVAAAVYKDGVWSEI